MSASQNYKTAGYGKKGYAIFRTNWTPLLNKSRLGRRHAGNFSNVSVMKTGPVSGDGAGMRECLP